jgi:hypothetical protein
MLTLPIPSTNTAHLSPQELHEWSGTLSNLDLTGSVITTAAPLASLTTLERLNLGGSYARQSPLEDVSPLFGIAGLRQLDLAYTAVPAAQKTELAERIPRLRVLGYADRSQSAFSFPTGALP